MSNDNFLPPTIMHSQVLDRLQPVDAVIAKARVFNVSFAAVTKYNTM